MHMMRASTLNVFQSVSSPGTYGAFPGTYEPLAEMGGSGVNYMSMPNQGHSYVSGGNGTNGGGDMAYVDYTTTTTNDHTSQYSGYTGGSDDNYFDSEVSGTFTGCAC